MQSAIKATPPAFTRILSKGPGEAQAANGQPLSRRLRDNPSPVKHVQGQANATA